MSMTLDEAQELAFGELGLCGCADEAALELIAKCMRRLETLGAGCQRWDDFVKENFDGNEAAAYCVHFLLDVAELTDHGTSIRMGFLTPKGQEFLDAIDEHGVKAFWGDA